MPTERLHHSQPPNRPKHQADSWAAAYVLLAMPRCWLAALAAQLTSSRHSRDGQFVFCHSDPLTTCCGKNIVSCSFVLAAAVLWQLTALPLTSCKLSRRQHAQHVAALVEQRTPVARNMDAQLLLTSAPKAQRTLIVHPQSLWLQQVGWWWSQPGATNATVPVRRTHSRLSFHLATWARYNFELRACKDLCY